MAAISGALVGMLREWRRRLSSSSSSGGGSSSAIGSSSSSAVAGREMPLAERTRNLSLAKRAVLEMRRAQDQAEAMGEETRRWLAQLTHDAQFLDYCRRGFRRASSSSYSSRGSYHLYKNDEEELCAITECLERLSREDLEANRRLMLCEDLCFELVRYAGREEAAPTARLNVMKTLISMAQADAALLCVVTALEVTDLPGLLFKRTNCSKETLLAARDLHLLVRNRGCDEEELRNLGILGSSSRSTLDAARSILPNETTANNNNNNAFTGPGSETSSVSVDYSDSPTNSLGSLRGEMWSASNEGSSSSSMSECTLCYGPLVDRVRLLPCNHAFCFNCVVSWNLCYQGPSGGATTSTTTTTTSTTAHEEDYYYYQDGGHLSRPKERSRKPCALCRCPVKSIQFF